jgi:eukaryotic-like serine/threonine-protein kinase
VRAGGYQNQSYWKHEFLKNGKKISWAEAMASFADSTGRPGPTTWQAGDYPEGQDDFPVAGVSWYEAVAYAEFVKKSLPTIYHWAAPNLYPSWNGFWPSSIIVPLSNFGSAGTLRVGSCEGINIYGIYDMAGNVREWCFNQAPEGRSLRGGAWNDYTYMFSDVTQVDPFDRSPRNGFRCACYPEPGKIPEAAFGPTLRAKLREFAKEHPVPDDMFESFKRNFSYDKAELNVKLEASNNSEYWIMEKVSFDAAYDKERMFAYLFLPKNSKPPFQVVIFFPGIGALSRDERAISEIPIFDFFLKNGRAVLLPIYKGTFERSEGLPYPDTSIKHRDYLFKLGKDFSRSIDYLGSRSDMDMRRIAFFGLSWGACLSPVLPAIEPRVKASISVLGGFWNNWRYGLPPEADQFNYAPRVKVPVLMLNGEYDSSFPYEAYVKPMFNLLGTPAKDKFLKHYPTDHSIPRNDLIKESLWFLDRYFGPVKSGQ